MTLTESSTAAAPTPPGRSGDSVSPGLLVGLVLGAVAIGVAGLIGVVALGLAIGGDSESEAMPSTVIDVSLTEFAITGNLVAPAGEVTLRATNDGSMSHNIGVQELDALSPNFGPGGTVELALGELAPGTYTVYCEIAGHADSGMLSILTVTGDSASAAEGAAVVQEAEHDYAAMDRAMMETILAFPAETEGRGNQILEPTEVLADGTKVFDMEASIIDWEIEPGKMVEAWAYNGQVPGPQILLDRGDKIQVRFTNNLPMGTDVHWHGVHTPNDMDGVAPLTQDLIEPEGGTFLYEFTVDDDAIGMYHAHNHGQMQVVNGMFGVFRVGDNPIPYGSTISGVTLPDDLEVALDIPMILNDAGTIGLSLNGKSFPATDPLVVDQGDWVSITYYNEGLQIHPMHLHQFPQLVYAKDGVPLDEPYWVDTLNVAPGERYTVLFRADDPGVWVWHCHILTHVEREEGMFGMVTAIIVNEDPAFDPEEVPVRPHNWRKTASSELADDLVNGDDADTEQAAGVDEES